MTLSISTFFLFWMLTAVLYQAGVSFYTDNAYISLLSQLFVPLSIVLSSLLLAKNKVKREGLVTILLFSFFLFFSILVNYAEGKNIVVLLLGTIDNLKFLLVLLFLMYLPHKCFILTAVGSRILSLLYYLLVISVIFSCLQQLNKQFVYIFPSSSEFKELYRYGLLRVPSFFAAVNAFAKISFLLIPISFLLKKNIKFTIVLTLIAFLMTFSRQFLLGVFISSFISLFLSGFYRKKSSLKINVVAILSITLIFTVSFLGSNDVKNEIHDGKLLSIPDTYIRTAVAITSLNAAIDNPVFGVGSGYFGGNIGKKFGINSELKKYGMMDIIPYFDLSDVYYTDTLWPQLLGEYGFLGFGLIVYIFYLWFSKLKQIRNVKYKFVSLLMFFQYLIVGFTSPVFNYPYFSIPILVMSMILVANDEYFNSYEYVS